MSAILIQTHTPMFTYIQTQQFVSKLKSVTLYWKLGFACSLVHHFAETLSSDIGELKIFVVHMELFCYLKSHCRVFG